MPVSIEVTLPLAIIQPKAHHVGISGGKTTPLPPQLRIWDAEAIASAVTSMEGGYLSPLASLWGAIRSCDLVQGPLEKRLATASLPIVCDSPIPWVQRDTVQVWAEGWQGHSVLSARQQQQNWREARLSMGVAICHVAHRQEGGKLSYGLTHIPPHATGFNALSRRWHVYLAEGGSYLGEKVECIGPDWWVCQAGEDPIASLYRGYWRTFAELFYGVRIADSEWNLFLRNQAGGKTVMALPESNEAERAAVTADLLAARNNSVLVHSGQPGAIESAMGGAGPSDAFQQRLTGLGQRIDIALTGVSQNGTETVGLGGSSGARSTLLAAQSDEVLLRDSQLFGELALQENSPLYRVLAQRGVPGLKSMSLGWDISRSATVGAQLIDQNATLDLVQKARVMKVPVDEPLLLERANIKTIQPEVAS